MSGEFTADGTPIPDGGTRYSQWEVSGASWDNWREPGFYLVGAAPAGTPFGPCIVHGPTIANHRRRGLKSAGPTVEDIRRMNAEAAARRAEEDAYLAATEHRSVVYFWVARDFVKIGWANNLLARMRNLQIDQWAAPDAIYFRAGSLEDERAMHRQFDEFRVRGEWFARTPTLEAWIVANCHPYRYGDPHPRWER